MIKAFQLKQIFMSNPNTDNEYTNYQKQLQPRVNFEPESLKELFLKHERALMDKISNEASLYLADEDTCNDDEDMFPRRCELTGEWYVGDVRLWEDRNRIQCSIYTRFLGFNPEPSVRPPVDDYLGMDAWFMYDEGRDTFIFDGFNTDAI